MFTSWLRRLTRRPECFDRHGRAARLRKTCKLTLEALEVRTVPALPRVTLTPWIDPPFFDTSGEERVYAPFAFDVTADDADAGMTTFEVNFRYGGTATFGLDFGDDRPRQGKILIEAGPDDYFAGERVFITTLDDTIPEGEETIEVELLPGSGYELAGNQRATFTIIDNDAPLLSIGGVTIAENADEVYAEFPVTLTPGSTQKVTVQWHTEEATALAGADFYATSGLLEFAPGQRNQTVRVPIVDDSLDEDDERFAVRLHDARLATLYEPLGWAMIVDDDPPPVVQFALASASALESVANPRLEVKLSRPSGRTVSVPYAVTGGDAYRTAPFQDYDLADGTATFAPGETSYLLPITVLSDTLVELDESIVVTLGAPSWADRGPNVIHTYQILNDDPWGVVSIERIRDALEPGQRTGQFLVSRTGPTVAPLTVHYTVGGTATVGADYAALSGIIVIPENESSVIIPITPVDDQLYEDHQTVVVALAANRNYLVDVPGQATLLVVDDDVPAVDLQIGTPRGLALTLMEAINFQIVVSNSELPTQAHSVERHQLRKKGWKVVSTQQTSSVIQRLAGYFEFRGSATINGQQWFAPGPTNIYEVQFPNHTEVVSDARVRAKTAETWEETKQFARDHSGAQDANGEYPDSLRQEYGYWIFLNTATGAYEFGPRKEGKLVGPKTKDKQGSVQLAPRPADVFAGDGEAARYAVATFHTHTPLTYLRRTLFRPVGPSPTDSTLDKSLDVVGVVYDYVGQNGELQGGHGLDDPAQLYSSRPQNVRRKTPH